MTGSLLIIRGEKPALRKRPAAFLEIGKKAVEIRLGQLVIHGALQVSQLVFPRVFVHPELLKAQLLIHMLGAAVVQVGVQERRIFV